MLLGERGLGPQPNSLSIRSSGVAWQVVVVVSDRDLW